METEPPKRRPINCPVCQSLLKVLHDKPELCFCQCLECGTNVIVHADGWAKYEKPDAELTRNA
jgi:hypothetical protein